jgi:hypothetical protein
MQPLPVRTLPTATACSSTQQASQTRDGAHTSTGTRQCQQHRCVAADTAVHAAACTLQRNVAAPQNLPMSRNESFLCISRSGHFKVWAFQGLGKLVEKAAGNKPGLTSQMSRVWRVFCRAPERLTQTLAAAGCCCIMPRSSFLSKSSCVRLLPLQ